MIICLLVLIIGMGGLSVQFEVHVNPLTLCVTPERIPRRPFESRWIITSLYTAKYKNVAI